MLTRRIATSVCALCLAIPAAAGASEGTNPPRAQGPAGIVPPGPRSTVKAKGAYGIVPPGPLSTVKAKGPYGIVPPGPRSFVKGITLPPQDTTGGPVHAAGASHRHDANGWGAAAITEAALLAALALGSALLLPARRRGAHIVT